MIRRRGIGADRLSTLCCRRCRSIRRTVSQCSPVNWHTMLNRKPFTPRPDELGQPVGHARMPSQPGHLLLDARAASQAAHSPQPHAQPDRHAEHRHVPDQAPGPLVHLRARLSAARANHRRIQFRKGTGAAAGQLVEWACIEPFQQWLDRLVDFVHGRERVMPQSRHHPAFHHLHGRLDLGFILRRMACRQHRRAVMAREIEHRIVGARLVAVRIRDHGAWFVGYDIVPLRTACTLARQ
jgi:hypothetical protein